MFAHILVRPCDFKSTNSWHSGEKHKRLQIGHTHATTLVQVDPGSQVVKKPLHKDQARNANKVSIGEQL